MAGVIGRPRSKCFDKRGSGGGVKTINIVQAGYGLIGGTVARQIGDNRTSWQNEFGVDVRITGVTTSSGFVASAPDGIDFRMTEQLSSRRADGRLSAGADAPDLRHAILMDAAAGAGTANLAEEVLGAGGQVVYSNKAPLSQSTTQASVLWQAAESGNVRYETTCGAGLPVISTLKSLLATGDEVIEIVGCLSGTLGAIFSSIAAGDAMSLAIRDAKAAGYTEPDPRDDLSGLDVARKALIL